MKKIISILCIFALTFTFSACGDDDDDVVIVGTWKLEKATIDKISSNNRVIDAALKESFKEMNYGNTGMSITFYEDGTYVTDADSETPESGTYVVKDGKIIVTFDGETETFQIQGGRLRLTKDFSKSELEELFDGELEGYIINQLAISFYFKK